MAKRNAYSRVVLVLLALTLAAAPVHIETLGFSVEVQGDVINVVEITPGSSAEAAGLKVGVHIERVFAPTYSFARGPLAKLSAIDLHDALNTSHDEALVFSGSLDGAKKTFKLTRTDPRPPPLTAPLPMAQVQRLSMVGQSIYYANLSKLMAPKPRPPDPLLAYDEQVNAQVSPAGVHRVINGAATPEWIYLDDKIHYSCPNSPMRSIELVSVAPVKKVLATSNSKSLRGDYVEAQIPMWRVKDARDACKRGESKLPSVELSATVRCEGAEPLSVPFSLPLTLECLSAAPASDTRIRSEEVLVGTATTKLAVQWSALRPTPLEATVVELNDAGQVGSRFTKVPPREDDERVELELKLDTSAERKIQLALELKYPDGSVGLTPVQVVNVVSKAKREKDQKEFASLNAKSKAVLARMGKQFKDPCANPDATVEWLRAQPEVTVANNHEGHNLSFTVGWLPFMVNCHRE